jgi:hypothetical protein
MKKPLTLLLCFLACAALAQPKLELTPTGFPAIEIARPDKTNEKLIEASKDWAPSYNRQQHDVYDVTANSLSIDAIRENAFFYRNLGEIYSYRIRYTLKVVFGEKTCRLEFFVRDIYAKKTLTKMTVGDFFTPEGKLKEDYAEVKPSLEKTANNILQSYTDFISN